MFRKAFSFLAVLSLLLLGGCAPHVHRPLRDAQGRIVLDFWNGFTGPDGVTMNSMVQLFEKENPDIIVHMQLIPWGTYYDKLTLAMAYGGTPDVFVIQSNRFPEFASYHTLRPLTDLYASDPHPLTAKDFSAKPWNESFYHGVQYALPLDIWPAGMFYNTKLFQQAGIVDAQGRAVPPKTLAEFLADARKLTKWRPGQSQADQWGFVFTDPNEHDNWFAIADQFGGSVVTPNGQRGAMDSPQNIAATRLMRDFVTQYRIAPEPEGVDSWLLFREGKAAMAIEGIYMLHDLQQQPGLQFAGAPIPQFGPIQATWGGSHLLCQPVHASPARAKAAWRFMRFLSDHSLLWGIGGQVPARLSVQRSAAFQALPVQSQFAKEVPYVQYEVQIPQANSLMQFVDPAINDALNGLQTPQAAMRDADRHINQLLRREKGS